MTAYDLMRKNLEHLTVTELLQFQKDISNILNKDNLPAKAWIKMNEEGKLHAVKFVKEFTGWGLKEAKDYCDALESAGKAGVEWKQ